MTYAYIDTCVLRKPWIWDNPWIVLRKAWIGRYPQFAQDNPWIAPRRAGGSLKRKRTVARSGTRCSRNSVSTLFVNSENSQLAKWPCGLYSLSLSAMEVRLHSLTVGWQLTKDVFSGMISTGRQATAPYSLTGPLS